MDYSKNYLQISGLADRLRESATQKTRGGFAERIRELEDIREDFTLTQANYFKDIQDMFAETRAAQESLAMKEPEQDLGEPVVLELEEGAPRPMKNPKRFAEDFPQLSERELLALTIQAEAGGEGYKGMLAVGAVMDNRRKSRGFGDSMKDVLLAPGQFSAWNSLTGYAKGEGGLDMSKIRPSKEAYKVADQILSGEYESPVGSATHYYNPDAADPVWGERRAGGKWQRIGNHIFGFAG